MTAKGRLQRYGDFQPTGFDSKGAFLPDRQDWLVGPCSRTRDSGALDESNYAGLIAALEKVDPDREDYEEHSFGHWGPGWFEIVLVRPGTKAAEVADDIARALENYPVLDEMDLSQREYDEANEAWENYAASDFRVALEKNLDVEIDEATDGQLRDLYTELCEERAHVPSEYESTDEGASFFVDRVAEVAMREDLTAHGITFEATGTFLTRL